MTISPAAIRSAVFAQQGFAGRFFDTLRALTPDPEGGIRRDTYGPGENLGHEVMARAAADSGLALRVDPAGNSYATRAGTVPGARRVIMGSHLDSVPRGGNFDGAAGPLAGLVAIRALDSLGLAPRADLCAMGIRAEESIWFQLSYIGSRLALGTLPEGALDQARRIDTGRTLAEHMTECGCNVAVLRDGWREIDPAGVDAYIEVHIEQAPSLVEEGRPLGICTGIPGNFRYPDARITGVHGHVGTPLRFRRDAGMAAVALAARMDTLWRGLEAAGTPAAITFGRFHTDAEYHGLTIVPGLFHFSLDVRAYDEEVLAELERAFLGFVAAVEQEYRVKVDPGSRKSVAPGRVGPALVAGLTDSAERLGVGAMPLGSPASHDAAAFAEAGVPMAMLFVRNENGSHNPDEAMEIADFLEVCAVLTDYLAREYCD